LCSAWQQLILAEVLGYRGQALREGSQLPRELLAVPGTAPDGLLMGRSSAGPGSGLAETMLIYRRPWATPLTQAVKGLPSVAEQAAELCRRRGLPLALLTNGRMWVLVHARPGEPTSVAEFDADVWSEEPLLLRAFASMLGVRCAVGSLASLFERTAADKSAVTDTLGRQVREAVELLVAELSRLDREAAGSVLAGIEPREVYWAALTVMMRVVFLLYAEEQALLPTADDLYGSSYSVTGLYERLDQEDVLIADRGASAWPRLLATFRAIHGGSQHPDMRIPAYGGSLFDPARYPWLEHAAVMVSDRVVYAVLDALVRLKQGKTVERLSYKALDVEQIGHVYEGLLDHSAVKLEQAMVGLRGKADAEIPLALLEEWRDQGVLEAEATRAAGLTQKQFASYLAAVPSTSERGQLHAACDNDATLAERVLPFYGLLRLDLRDSPCVYPRDSVIVTQVGDRRGTGTHYTPRSLGEEIVLHTLDPLCYSPGPAAGDPRLEDGSTPESWEVRTAAELLALKVLDPAMGSGAFLVSACRYLSERLVEAWQRDGLPEEVTNRLGEQIEDRDLLLLEARRMVADRCLYGVDIDEMAVELAKLSLWLVTLAKGRPFNFVDHALRRGDSLLGCLTPSQIENFHLKPEAGRILNARLTGDISERTGPLLSRAAELRREIESFQVLDIRDARKKSAKLKEAEELTEQLRLVADAVVGARLATAAAKSSDAYDDRLASIADLVEASMSDPEAARKAREIVDGWLQGADAGPRKAPLRPLHWPLEFPEIAADPSRTTYFDAVVGNPPFSGGQKLTGNLGTDYREYLVDEIGKKARGGADLCAYFLLRNLQLARKQRVGVITTNTIAQGDTREVGLDQATSGVEAWTVYRAVKSQPWPGTAALEVSLLWLGQPGESERYVLDGAVVRGITPSLDPKSRVSGKPFRLAANKGKSFIGSYVLGMGFILTPEQAEELIQEDPRNKEVLFPYLNGEDLNSRPDCSASRWVINFHDWPEERARSYPAVFGIVERDVKPERSRNRDRQRREIWWRFTRPALDLYRAVQGLERVLVVALVSRTVMPVMVPTGQVFSHKLGIFSFAGPDQLALMNSGFHTSWAWRMSSTMKADLNYSPSDVFETLPQPAMDDSIELARLGELLDITRSRTMLDRQLGLTKLYNAVHDSSVHDSEIQRLRDLHEQIDHAVAAAYGWTDLDLSHAFQYTRQGVRHMLNLATRAQILDRLLELNHARHNQGPGNESVKTALSLPDLAPNEDVLF
jgi:hypothetical protein